MWNVRTDAERAVLGAALLDVVAASAACKALKPRDFHAEHHEKIFKAIERLQSAGKTADIVTVANLLYGDTDFMSPDELVYLSELPMEVPSTANVGQYIAIVRERAARRRADKVAQALTQAARDEARDITDTRMKAINALSQIALSDEQEDTSMGAVMQAGLDYAERRRHDGMNNTTGIHEYDRATGGLHPGEMTILAARTGQGKSTFAWQLAHTFAKRGQRVMFVSCEMSHEQHALRCCAMHGMNTDRIKAGNATDDDMAEMARIMGKVEDLPLSVDTLLHTPQEIRAKANDLVKHGGLGLLVVDYLQLLGTGRQTRKENQNVEVSEISKALKRITLELNVPVLALSQLNREVEKRARKVPTLSDLRDSGSLEQDADNVVFLSMPKEADDVSSADRSEYERHKMRGNRLTYLHIAKQRQGGLADFKLVFIPTLMQFIGQAPEWLEKAAKQQVGEPF